MPKATVSNGDALLKLARLHIGETYHLGAFAPKNNANWTGPWDCAEFASWLVFQTAGSLYGCDRDFGDPATADAYTGYWERDAKNLGEIIPIAQAAQTAGAVVLRFPLPGAIGHVVISDGRGGTVEAHSSQDGVVALTLSNRRWDAGILIPGIQYTTGSARRVRALKVVYRLMTPPMSGPKVSEIQRKLKAAAFDPGVIDGVFGPHTHAAVVAFQLSRGMVGDGEVGSSTAKALGVKL